jgi:hypothetical protein
MVHERSHPAGGAEILVPPRSQQRIFLEALNGTERFSRLLATGELRELLNNLR